MTVKPLLTGVQRILKLYQYLKRFNIVSHFSFWLALRDGKTIWAFTPNI